MRKLFLILCALLILFLGIVVSLNLGQYDHISKPEVGLRLTSITTAIGAVDNETDRQSLSYRAYLFNGLEDEVYVDWVEPLLHEELSKRLLTKDSRVVVSMQLAPGVSIEITGSVIFSSEGLSKEEIAKWEPLFTGIKVLYHRQGHSVQEILPIPGIVITSAQVLKYGLLNKSWVVGAVQDIEHR